MLQRRKESASKCYGDLTRVSELLARSGSLLQRTGPIQDDFQRVRLSLVDGLEGWKALAGRRWADCRELAQVNRQRYRRSEFEVIDALDRHRHQLAPASKVELLAIHAPRRHEAASVGNL